MAASVASEKNHRTHAQQAQERLPFYLNLTTLSALPRPREREIIVKNPGYDPNWGILDSKDDIRIPFIIMVVKSILFAIPPLIMGIVYRSQCQVQEWIPRFLMVLGVECIVENICLLITMVIITFVQRKKPKADIYKQRKLSMIVWAGIGTICTFAWYIAGSVWVYSVKNRVQFDDAQSPNYCHPGVYWYTFVWCILWYAYLLIAISCIPCIYKFVKDQVEVEKMCNPREIAVKY
ncbi:unnamed protein product [Adineta ricciae]|uniref:Uncharacterized protein n=1 Tax=Adineta ricciae TaxID=249248 RepID=A0A815ATQ3_ADIRI|nr:unnamed protein product [Adineta ricciae]CAF1261119.1 unnamed protein product [Adineta ricciae]